MDIPCCPPAGICSNDGNLHGIDKETGEIAAMRADGRECCAQCYFWTEPAGNLHQIPAQLRDGGDILGFEKECHKRSPEVANHNRSDYRIGTAAWPRTRGDRWCGDFKQYVDRPNTQINPI
jgi:hypothetical protein